MKNLMPDNIPLYVDLDGTFFRSDTLHESFLSALKRKPYIILLAIFWLIKGKSYLKHRISSLASLDVNIIPRNAEFYNFLEKEKEKGREIVLATAANTKIAESVVKNFPIFSSFIASSDSYNLKGKNKLKAIHEKSANFSYAGNDGADSILFNSAEEKYLVNPSLSGRLLIKSYKFDRIFDRRTFDIKTWIKQLRVYQWLKNFLLFVPLFVSGLYLEVSNLIYCALGFISFSLLASSTYILNDLLDLNSDRTHPTKKNRPLASSKITILGGGLVAALLFIISIIIAFLLSGPFKYVLLTYLALTLLYSFVVKSYVGMDVILLSGLYTIRIFAGSYIISVTPSFWLLSFSMFVFFSLALVKRCAELKALLAEKKSYTQGRDYNVDDYSVLLSLGTSSAMIAVVMFCFYTQSDALENQYQDPNILWLAIPAIGYWLSRMWIKTCRGEMTDDPIVFSIKDKGSAITVLFIGLITLAAQLL